MRGLVLALALAAASPAAACIVDPFSKSVFSKSLTVDLTPTGQIGRAWFDQPTDLYDHGILGRKVEPEGLMVQDTPGGAPCGTLFKAGAGHVFEDTAPRLADLDGDGENEVIVVRSSITKGAQLAVYGNKGNSFGLIAATDYIGQKNRWLAPAGIADFDGDGRLEIAYVDRPHLLGDLVFVRRQGQRLVEIARMPGASNHRIGDAVISGGVRNCGLGVELVLADKDWAQVLVVSWQDGPKAQNAGAYSAKAMQAALDCR